MTTIKEYADKWGITTQAVYKQLQTHAAELEGHIHTMKGSNARWLDDEAVAILERIRETNPVVIERDSSAELIAALRQEIDDLRKDNQERSDREAALLREVAQNAKALASSAAEKQLLEAQKNHEIALLQANVELRIREAEDNVRNELQQMHNLEIAAINAQLEQERAKTWWQKLLGK